MAALVVTVLVALVTVAAGQCPGPSQLQTADGIRVCALLYTEDSVYYDNCCRGKSVVVDPGSDVPYMPVGYSGRISSLVVGTDCELTVWSRSGKEGNSHLFLAGTVPRLQEVERGIFSNWDNAIRSYYCTCY